MPHRFGSWQLDALITAGGLGEIWRASRGDGEVAAVKRLHTHLLSNDLARAQFAIEQDLAVNLPPHPNLIHATEAGVVDGRPYVALELLPGRDLRSRTATGSAAVSRSRAIEIVIAACDGVTHLHSHGWIHGDINPSNLIADLSESGRVVLIDLGISRRIGATGTVRGTHAYMAPEQIRGEPWTSATDVFALGVVLWELTSGTRLFHRGPPWLSMAAVMKNEPPPLPDPSLDAIVRTALAKPVDARTRSPSDLAAALRSWRDPCK